MMKKILEMVKKMGFLGKLSLLIIIIIFTLGIFSEQFSSYPYNDPSGEAFIPPNRDHILGTDDLGMDLWAQILQGAKISMFVGLTSAFIAGFGGAMIGMLAGYYGGIIDRLIMRFIDILIVIPDLPLMIVIGAFFGPSVKNIIIILVLFSWTQTARIVRSKILSIKEESYIKVAESYDAGFLYLVWHHFLPQILPIVMVSIIRLISRAIVSEASLSFLGLGDPTSKSWGLILSYAIGYPGIYFMDYWKWWVMSPLIAIILLVMSIAFLSLELEKLLDSKL